MMKWSGWIMVLCVGVLCVAVHQNNTQKKSLLDTEIRAETKAWEASVTESQRVLASATRQLEEKLAQAKQKSVELQARKQAAETALAQVTAQVAVMEAEVAKLENVKAESSTVRRDNLQEIRQLQAQIAGIMPDLEKLKDAMAAVTEPAEAAQGRE